ncbi:hypothetical protein ASNO1_75510 [Corallococcus caeni]|uniref:Uncharacterized protein n=1 Tax=Corallococcus caeni TaxID=3082388 RepID=A0ABQ6R4Z5_9BACT|nr:hypothetical protein ASNO1_75510 [Corallococcus sp. NO1]
MGVHLGLGDVPREAWLAGLRPRRCTLSAKEVRTPTGWNPSGGPAKGWTSPTPLTWQARGLTCQPACRQSVTAISTSARE